MAPVNRHVLEVLDLVLRAVNVVGPVDCIAVADLVVESADVLERAVNCVVTRVDGIVGAVVYLVVVAVSVTEVVDCG